MTTKRNGNHHLLPMAPLLAWIEREGYTTIDVAEFTGFGRRSLHRATARGWITRRMAEDVCHGLGIHPACLWLDDYYEGIGC